MADRTYQLSSSPTLPVVIAVIAGVLAVAVLLAHFSGRTWFAKSRRPNFGAGSANGLARETSWERTGS